MQRRPAARIVHDRNSISFGNSLEDTANYNAAYSSDPPAVRERDSVKGQWAGRGDIDIISTRNNRLLSVTGYINIYNDAFNK